MQKLLFALALAMMVSPVFAHAFLDEASPKVGAAITEAPKEIRITYTEAIEPAFSHIELFDGAGQAVALGALTADGKQLAAPVTGKVPPGHYEVRWNVLSVDTHRTNGHFSFDYQP